ncbi:hypothetical protein ACFYUJ_12050 [Streptomyces sp. NPDC004520]
MKPAHRESPGNAPGSPTYESGLTGIGRGHGAVRLELAPACHEPGPLTSG